MSGLRELSGATFRANPSFQLVPYDRLDEAERAMLAGIVSEAPDFYGILRPLREGLNVKTLSREAALLWYTLRDPGAMPTYTRTLFGDRYDIQIAQLVSDEVLEIEDEGRFVSGRAAHARIYDEVVPQTGNGRIAELSRAAIEYADRLFVDEAAVLAARIYFYNRVPVSPRWARQVPTPDAATAFLGLTDRGAPRGDRWKALDPTPSNEGWRMFQLRRGSREGRRGGFKLYVSPRCEYLREALSATASVLERRAIPRFKVGRDLPGFLRPDKLVVYCESLDEVKETADDLLARLRHVPPHGVPLTSEIGGDGLLSWGMDPPRDSLVLEWQAQTSWRVWLAGRLAVALVAARQSAGSVTAVQCAIDRVRLEGVDPDSWTPRQSLWAEA
jgi:hypothetical protein